MEQLLDLGQVNFMQKLYLWYMYKTVNSKHVYEQKVGIIMVASKSAVKTAKQTLGILQTSTHCYTK